MWCAVHELLSETLSHIETAKDEDGRITEIVFTTKDGSRYRMYHEQDCCESVTVEDICNTGG